MENHSHLDIGQGFRLTLDSWFCSQCELNPQRERTFQNRFKMLKPEKWQIQDSPPGASSMRNQRMDEKTYRHLTNIPKKTAMTAWTMVITTVNFTWAFFWPIVAFLLPPRQMAGDHWFGLRGHHWVVLGEVHGMRGLGVCIFHQRSHQNSRE